MSDRARFCPVNAKKLAEKWYVVQIANKYLKKIKKLSIEEISMLKLSLDLSFHIFIVMYYRLTFFSCQKLFSLLYLV